MRNFQGLPSLTLEQILAWADAFHQRTGQWPKTDSSPRLIDGSGGEKWRSIDNYLRLGLRDLPGGSSLAHLLAESREVRNIGDLPSWTVDQILAWADAFHERTGQWPRKKNWYETIHEAPEETWLHVEEALSKGLRGLPGGSSLAQVLAQYRGVHNVGNLPPLTVDQILAWADAFQERTGQWPKCRSSEQLIEGSGGERWLNVDQALRKGLRRLPGGSSLAGLLAQRRSLPSGSSRVHS